MEVAEENGIDIPGPLPLKASTIAAPVGCAWSRCGSPKLALPDDQDHEGMDSPPLGPPARYRRWSPR